MSFMTSPILIPVRPRFTYKPELKVGNVKVKDEVIRLEIVKDYHAKDKEKILEILKACLNTPSGLKVELKVPEDKKLLIKSAIEILQKT